MYLCSLVTTKLKCSNLQSKADEICYKCLVDNDVVTNNDMANFPHSSIVITEVKSEFLLDAIEILIFFCFFTYLAFTVTNINTSVCKKAMHQTPGFKAVGNLLCYRKSG